MFIVFAPIQVLATVYIIKMIPDCQARIRPIFIYSLFSWAMAMFYISVFKCFTNRYTAKDCKSMNE